MYKNICKIENEEVYGEHFLKSWTLEVCGSGGAPGKARHGSWHGPHHGAVSSPLHGEAVVLWRRDYHQVWENQQPRRISNITYKHFQKMLPFQTVT